MSGRDFKNFLSAHQKQIGQQDPKLVQRFLAGHKPNYKPVDYEKVQLLTQIRKSSANRGLKRVEKLEQNVKKSREEQMIQEHRRLWEIEMRKLKESEEKVLREIELLHPLAPNLNEKTSAKEELYEEITDYEDHLRYELKRFVKGTVDTVLMLREDLLSWLKTNRHKLAIGHHDSQQEDGIIKTIESVKQQQSHLMEDLADQRREIEEEIFSMVYEQDLQPTDHGYETDRPSSSCSAMSAHTIASTSCYSTFGKLPRIELGPPLHLNELYCPDEQLREDCLLEFDVLDERYSIELETLEEQYHDVISNMPNNGWSDDDCLRFRHTINQYNSISNNRRQMYLHRLAIEFPEKTSRDIKNFEQFAFRHKSLQRRMKALLLAWRRDREDLILRVTAIFHEATLQYKKKQKDMIEHTKQKFVCNYLREKLNDYREERLELMKLEADEQRIREEAETRKRKAKEKKEKSKRDKEKQKIQEYKERQNIHTAQLEELDQLRLMELQERRAMQRCHDMERVRYRDEMRTEKLEDFRQEKLNEEMEQVEKEKRMKKITEQINSNVKEDANRIYEPTQTTLAHARVEDHVERDAKAPLFNVYTYNVNQVAQDKRVKIEAALRRANLHMTDYGRNMIANAQPPSKPRPDMQSTAFNKT